MYCRVTKLTEWKREFLSRAQEGKIQGSLGILVLGTGT